MPDDTEHTHHEELRTPAARLGQAQRARDQLHEALDRLQDVDPETHDRLVPDIIVGLRGRLVP